MIGQVVYWKTVSTFLFVLHVLSNICNIRIYSILSCKFPSFAMQALEIILAVFQIHFFFFFFVGRRKEEMIEMWWLRLADWGGHFEGYTDPPPGMKDLLPQLLQVLLEDDPHLSALPEDCHGLEEIALPSSTSLSRDCLHPVTDKGRSIRVWGVIPTLELTVARSDPIRGLHANSSPPSFQSCFLGLPSIGDDLGRTP